MKEKIDIATAGGHSIVAHVFATQKTARGVCIIAPATGVGQYLYDDFALWLTQQGYHVITFDYNGMGLSVDGHVKHCRSDKLGWAKYDCSAVIDYAQQHFPQQKLIWFGHSVGGHMLGMMENSYTNRLDKIITVASGTGTWWYNSAPTKRIVWLVWYFLVPLTVPLLGYFPGKKLKVMCDLPKDVMLQWRRWCLNEDYAVGHEGDWLRERFAGVKTPMTVLSFSDDEMMSPKSISDLHKFFSSAPQSAVTVHPHDVNQKAIRHIGWHRERYRELWDKFILSELPG